MPGVRWRVTPISIIAADYGGLYPVSFLVTRGPGYSTPPRMAVQVVTGCSRGSVWWGCSGFSAPITLTGNSNAVRRPSRSAALPLGGAWFSAGPPILGRGR